jgi:hypothetical protein
VYVLSDTLISYKTVACFLSSLLCHKDEDQNKNKNNDNNNFNNKNALKKCNIITFMK